MFAISRREKHDRATRLSLSLLAMMAAVFGLVGIRAVTMPTAIRVPVDKPAVTACGTALVFELSAAVIHGLMVGAATARKPDR
jgi:hypothetical protein